jgi:hypothetical protein
MDSYGETSKSIIVQVNGDTTIELVESFTVDLSNPSNANISDGIGVGMILNDDAAIPMISFPDFSNSNGLTLIGESTFASSRLRLSSNGDRTGGAWADTKQFVSTAFETSFDFQLDASSNGRKEFCLFL